MHYPRLPVSSVEVCENVDKPTLNPQRVQQVIRLQASVEVRSTSPHGLSISWSAALEAPEG